VLVMAPVHDIRLGRQTGDAVHHQLMRVHVEETGKVLGRRKGLRVGLGQMNTVFQRCENGGDMG
jgi:hypothetical protein